MGNGTLREAVEGMVAMMHLLFSQSLRLWASYALSAIRRLGGRTAWSSGSAMLTSATLPGVSARAIGRPRPLARQWILLVDPPRERPIAWVHAPFSACRRAVRLHVRRVEHQLGWDRPDGGDLFKQPLPFPRCDHLL